MSTHDYSGIDTRRGRWWGPIAGTLMVLGIAGALLVLAVATGQAIGD